MIDRYYPPPRNAITPELYQELRRLYDKVYQLQDQLAALPKGSGGEGSKPINAKSIISIPSVADSQLTGSTFVGAGSAALTPTNNAVSSVDATSTIPGSSISGGPITSSGTFILALTSALLFRTAIGAAPLVPTVVAYTSGPVNLVTTDSFQVITNTGAAGSVTFNLPAASTTGFFLFVRDANFDMVIDANGTDTIRGNGAVTSAGGTATLFTVGSAIWITALKPGAWFSVASEGLLVFA